MTRALGEVEHLVELLGAPERAPARTPWRVVERALNVSLPGDYKAFIDRMGGGGLGRDFWIYDPLSKTPAFDLLKARTSFFRGLVWLGERELFPARRDPPLLAWGQSGEGHSFHWRIAGKLDPGHVVVEHARGARRFETHDLSFVQFVRAYVSGLLKSRLLRTPEQPVVFSPVRRAKRIEASAVDALREVAALPLISRFIKPIGPKGTTSTKKRPARRKVKRG